MCGCRSPNHWHHVKIGTGTISCDEPLGKKHVLLQAPHFMAAYGIELRWKIIKIT